MKRKSFKRNHIFAAVLILAVSLQILPEDVHAFSWGGWWGHETSTEASGEPTSEEVTTSSEESEPAVTGYETSSEGPRIYTTESKETTEKETSTEETSATEAAVHEPYSYNGYLIDTVIAKDVQIPQGFILAYDTQRFARQLQAFYSSSYSIFVYHGSKDGAEGYYIYDKLNDTLMDFVLLQNRQEETPYIVIQPVRLSTVPGILKGQTTVEVTNCFDAAVVSVPAFSVVDAGGNNVTVLYLASANNTSEYYVYSDERGIPVLTEWNEYAKNVVIKETSIEKTTETEKATKKEKTTEEKTSTTAASTTRTESATSVQETEPLVSASIFKKPLTWGLIVLGLFFLVLITVLIVFRINKRQDEEEAELAPDFDSFRNDGFGSNYQQGGGPDLQPFDVNFEDAFPEEMRLPNTAPPEITMDADSIMIGEDPALKPSEADDE